MPDTKPKRDFLTFIKREIDITNLRTLLKLKQANLPADKIRTYLIKGGRDLDLAELNRLSGLETFEQLIDELSKLPFYNEIKEGVETAKQTGNLSEAMLALQHYLVSESEKFSHMYPLSVLPYRLPNPKRMRWITSVSSLVVRPGHAADAIKIAVM